MRDSDLNYSFSSINIHINCLFLSIRCLNFMPFKWPVGCNRFIFPFWFKKQNYLNVIKHIGLTCLACGFIRIQSYEIIQFYTND